MEWGERSGSLRVEMAELGENYYTPNYMFYDKAMFVHDHEGTTALNYGVSGSVISPQKCAYYSINAADAPASTRRCQSLYLQYTRNCSGHSSGGER